MQTFGCVSLSQESVLPDELGMTGILSHMRQKPGWPLQFSITPGSCYPTTMFTSFPGTTMIFFTVLPSMNGLTFSEAIAAASSSD